MEKVSEPKRPPGRPPRVDSELNSSLVAIGLTQSQFGRLIDFLAGEAVAITTINRWASGKADTPPPARALIELLKRMSKTARAALYKEAGIDG